MNKSISFLKAIESKTQLGGAQALRYAISCTLATCAAAFIQQYWHFPAQLSTFFVLTAAVAVYFSYGENWFTQSATIMASSALVALTSLISILLQPHFIYLLIFFGAVSFLAYYFSGTNIATLFICKLGISLVCFTFDNLFSNDLSYAWRVSQYILAGGLLAMLVNLLLYIITPKLTLEKTRHLWYDELLRLLSQLQYRNKQTDLKNFSEIHQLFKTRLASYDAELAFIADRAGMALIRLAEYLKKYPQVQQKLTDELTKIFQAAENTIIQKQPQILLDQYKQLRKQIFLLREEKFFTAMEDSLRGQYSEILFLIDKFVYDVSRLICHTALQADAVPFKRIIYLQWSNLVASVKRNLIMDNVKIGLRAAITLSAALIFARFSHAEHVPWIVLTANIVLFVRQGDTIKRGFDRIVGHLAGFILAVPLGLYIWPYWQNPFIWLPLLVFFAAYFFLKNYFFYSAILMMVILYSYFLNSPVRLESSVIIPYISWRLYDVTVGAVIATLAGVLIFPTIGLKPIVQIVQQILFDAGKYLQLLKIDFTRSVKIEEILKEQQQLFQQLNHAQEVFQSLQFQPKRFLYDLPKTKKSILATEALLGLLASLPRRLYAAHPYLQQQLHLTAIINESLDYLRNRILLVAKNISLPRERSISPVIEPMQHQWLLQNVAQQKRIIFEYADQKKISYDELINTMGVLILIESVDKQLEYL